MFYVYQLRRADRHEPFYIGKGNGDRAWDHLDQTQWKFDGNKHKVNTIKKAIEDQVEILVEMVSENLTEEQALKLEISKISEFGRADLGLGSLTNMTDGGEGTSGMVREGLKGERHPLYGKSHSEETKLKMSISHSGKKSNPEDVAKRALSATGLRRSDESKANMREAAKNRPPVSEETKSRMKEAAKSLPGIECPHCHMLVKRKRWHFDNCKHKPN